MQWFQGPVLCKAIGVLSYVKTLQGLKRLNVSMVAMGARVQWFNDSVVQRRV